MPNLFSDFSLLHNLISIETNAIFDDPNDIVFLYQLAEKSPLLYAKLAMEENGLQDYVDAINEFN